MHKLSGPTTTLLTEGMGGRLKTKGGQLAPLQDRINAYQQARRIRKHQARATVAEQLLSQQRRFILLVGQELYRRTMRGRWNGAVASVKGIFTRKAA